MLGAVISYTLKYLNKGGAMVETTDRETVVVQNERRPSYGLIVFIVAVLLVILFFVFGGSDLFDSGSGTETINVDTPDTIQVEPTTQQ